MRTADPRLLVLAAVVPQAAVHGLMSGRVLPGESLVFSAVAFGLCTVIFLIVGRVTGADRLPVELRGLMVGMNVLSAITFLGFYASLTLIPASTTAALETAVAPVAVAVATRGAGLTPARWAGAGALGALAALLAARSWDAGTTVSGVDATAGVLLAVVAGCGMAGVAVLSRRFGDRGVGAITVTAHRFHLTYAAAVVLVLLSGSAEVPGPDRVGELAGYGVIAVIAPLILLQYGLQRADPLSAIVIIVTSPGITYLVQVATGAPYDAVTFVLIVGVIVLAALYNLTPRAVRAGRR